jgi:hypothetical protein
MPKRLEKDLEIHEIRLPIGLLKHDEYLKLAIPEQNDRIMFMDGTLFKICDPVEKKTPSPRLVVKKKEASE